jgi:subtilisin family serine protease
MQIILNLILSVLLFNGIAAAIEDYLPDEIYVQFHEELAVNADGNFQLMPQVESVFTATPIVEIRAVFPRVLPDKRLPGMERIYRIKIQNPERLSGLLQRLSENPAVVYAEPVPLRRMFEIPNDPRWNSQYHLSLLQVDSARSIHSGDKGVAIAIIDGGVNYLHEDLHSEIWVNSAEDVDGDGFLSPADNDGIDADNNGFVDDVIGWDFVHIPGQGFPGEDDSLADNDPMDFGGHGTHCAGDAAAATDNSIGIASVGGDCQIMCIRAGMTASNGFGYIYYSIEGIYYAVNNGAKVISMSYGGGSPSSTGQQAIDFAHSQGVICIAAAGNDNNNIPQYPANYNHVLAVAATDAQDLKADFSNYGTWIDLCAPGEAILSTVVGGGYGNQGGTSMSTPIVAGLTGLTWSMFPQYTNDEIIDRILAGCDDIDPLNPVYAGQLGAGRVNAFKTLDKVIRVLSVEILDAVSGNGNGRLDYGETADLLIMLKNTYQTISGVSATIHSLNTLLTVPDSLSFYGNMALGSGANNASDLFTITVGSDTTISTAELRVTITAIGGYQYQKVLELPVGQRDILIVNDDETGGTSKISYYTNALNELEKSYDIWDVQSQGLPGSNESGYSVIIWYTGEALQNVLTASEQQFLENYLNNGGRLFLTGQNIAYDLVEQQNGIPFFENYLHAAYVQNNANDFSLEGLPGDPIGAGQTFIILGSGGANNQNSPDIITAVPPAQAAIVYETANQTDQAAIYYSGTYRLVYFAFGWEGINDHGPAKRKEVMERVLNWLDQPTSIDPKNALPVVSQVVLYPNYPNPFNPETTISYIIPAGRNTSEVELTIYNSLGQKVLVLVKTRKPAGHYKVKWGGRDDSGRAVSSGIYYVQLRAQNSIQTRKMLLLR